MQQRREQLQAALDQAQAADQRRRRKGVNPEKNPAQVPTTDPDSKVMPNKEGGYAPNYTPVVTTDSQCGFIVDCDVLDEVNETACRCRSGGPHRRNVRSETGKVPHRRRQQQRIVMQQMEERGVEFYAPVESNQPPEGSPAKRDDPTQAVPESEWSNLKRNPQGQLDKSCFVYSPEKDQYVLPPRPPHALG